MSGPTNQNGPKNQNELKCLIFVFLKTLKMAMSRLALVQNQLRNEFCTIIGIFGKKSKTFGGNILSFPVLLGNCPGNCLLGYIIV